MEIGPVTWKRACHVSREGAGVCGLVTSIACARVLANGVDHCRDGRSARGAEDVVSVSDPATLGSSGLVLAACVLDHLVNLLFAADGLLWGG